LVTTSGLISSIVASQSRNADRRENRLHRARDLLQVQAELEREFARLERQQADRRLDDHLQ